MTKDQRDKLLQGVLFGLFFQFIGYKMRVWTFGAYSVRVGGTFALVAGCVIGPAGINGKMIYNFKGISF